jgi:hypothetical protein
MTKRGHDLLATLSCLVARPPVLGVDLESGQGGLLALEEDLAAMAAEHVVSKEEGEVRRHEFWPPSTLALHAVGILETLEKIALLAATAGIAGAVLASDGAPLLRVVLHTDQAALRSVSDGSHLERV